MNNQGGSKNSPSTSCRELCTKVHLATQPGTEFPEPVFPCERGEGSQ